MLPLQGPPGILVPYPLSPGPLPPERRLSPLHTHPEISILCLSLPSLAGFRDEFPLLCPPGEGSGSQLEKGGGIGHTRPPSASPLPLELFSIPATSALPLPGTDKVQLEAGTSCDCARSPQPPPRHQQTAAPPAPSWNPCPALAWLASKWRGGGEWSLRPCCPGNQTPHQEGEEEAREEGACGWVFGSSGESFEVNPTGLLWKALPHGPLPFQSPKVSKPASPRFSPGSPHSPELTLPPLGDGPGQATSSITRSSPEVEQDSEADLGETLVTADPTGGAGGP